MHENWIQLARAPSRDGTSGTSGTCGTSGTSGTCGTTGTFECEGSLATTLADSILSEVTPQKNPDRSLGLRNKKQKTILFAKFLWELFDAGNHKFLLAKNLSPSSFVKLLAILF